MNCRIAVLEVSNYLEGELTAEVKLELEEHLKACKNCTLVFDQTKLTIEVFCESEPVDLPTDVKSRLHETLRKKLGEARS